MPQSSKNKAAAAAAQAEAVATASRHSLNIKVLRRHDTSIDTIVDHASFVVLYQHDGSEWTKTGIEGPMFLYHRTRAPHHGFFLLNRNGVENFSAPLTSEDDLDLTEQFIIYRRASGEGRESVGEDGTVEGEEGAIYGIWIFEPEQRSTFGQQMARLQSSSPSPSSPSPTPNGVPKVVSEAASSSTAAPAPPPTTASNGLSLLDSMFQAASAQSPPHKNGATSSAPSASSGPTASALMSLLGSASPQPPPAQPSALNALFASARISSPAQSPAIPHPPHSQGYPSPIVHSQHPHPASYAQNGSPVQQRQHFPPFPSPHPHAPITHFPPPPPPPQAAFLPPHLAASALDDSSAAAAAAGRAAHSGPPLEKGEFVRGLLGLIHTNPAFVDDVYARYVRRLAAGSPSSDLLQQRRQVAQPGAGPPGPMR